MLSFNCEYIVFDNYPVHIDLYCANVIGLSVVGTKISDLDIKASQQCYQDVGNDGKPTILCF